METTTRPKKALLVLLKDLSTTHTVTSLAKQLNMSRVGMWKTLKKLEENELIKFNQVGGGKTSTLLIALNWGNILVEKTLALYLTEESLAQKRWKHTFAELEKMTHFLILYGSVLHSPKEAHDIDVMGIVSGGKRFVSTDAIIQKIQKIEMKKIHAIFFGREELLQELKKQTRAFIDAIKKGVVLSGQENYFRFMKKVHATWRR